MLHLGVTDFLVPYSKRKVIERVVKSIPYNAQGISVATPKDYGNRFVTFLSDVVRYNSYRLTDQDQAT